MYELHILSPRLQAWERGSDKAAWGPVQTLLLLILRSIICMARDHAQRSIELALFTLLAYTHGVLEGNSCAPGVWG